ncbi:MULTISPECIES: hypothetical protein [unclassified Microcoleus]|uniref:hypothetical protein n=1 Tax=unclassified Microcoleus TaxID=2642155 RepID=UPI002FD6FC6B
MAYSDFTLEQVHKAFGLTISEDVVVVSAHQPLPGHGITAVSSPAGLLETPKGKTP